MGNGKRRAGNAEKKELRIEEVQEFDRGRMNGRAVA